MPGAYVTGYYGKLPFSREFLRWNGAGVEMRELDPWLQEGMVSAKSRLGHELKKAVEKAEPWNFLFAPVRSSRLTLGVILPSLDQVGREYPFLAFLLIDQETMRLRRALLPLAFKGFLGRTRDLVRRLQLTQDWNAFKQAFESSNWTAPMEASQVQACYDAALNSVTVAEWCTEIWGDTTSRPMVEVLCSALVKKVAPHAGAHTPRSPVLRFPLVKGEKDETNDMPFWMDLTASVRTEWGDPRVMFWTRGSAAVDPCMVAGYGTPSPKMVQFILTPQSACPDWVDPFSSADTDRQAGSQDLQEIACDPRASLKRTLDVIRNISLVGHSSSPSSE
ncbi:MAG: type VI secretion system-associated protein TagF [Nitrospiraceae bacterium]